MWADELRVAEDVSPAAWIAPRLNGQFGAVTLAVPSGYPACVRICHPVPDPVGAPVGWSEVARATGRRAHPLMQWHQLVGPQVARANSASLWQGGEPDTGNLAAEVLGPLCDLLATHTAKPGRCFFCLWEGWGWVDGSGVSTVRMRPRVQSGGSAASEESRVPPFSTQELDTARVRLPGRDYLLLEGPLSAATKIGHWASPSWFIGQSPNLFWPVDRAWCAATEIDFDSTLIGGDDELIQAILDTPRFDAWVLHPDDSLACDADTVNGAA